MCLSMVGFDILNIRGLVHTDVEYQGSKSSLRDVTMTAMIQDGTCLANVFTAAALSPSAAKWQPRVFADKEAHREPEAESEIRNVVVSIKMHKSLC